MTRTESILRLVQIVLKKGRLEGAKTLPLKTNFKKEFIMKITNIIIVLAVMATIGAFTASSMATVGESKFSLMATKAHPGASGSAAISDSNISIHAKGLKPNSVYTVWFVNMKPKKHETGAGQAPYMFKTDPNGAGSYSSTLYGSPIGKWQMLMIVLHPNGNPKDMKNMVGALSTKF